MDSCIFCKIIKGEIPSNKIYEDKDLFAFLDIGPVNKGHVLVIPKKHSETLLETEDAILQKVILAVKNVSIAVKNGVKADGINIIQSNSQAAGQLVPHLHFHIIPRFKGDGFKHWPQGKYQDGEAEKVKNALIKAL